MKITGICRLNKGKSAAQKIAALFFTLVMVCAAVHAQSFSNPILPGFYPDPSVCRVDSDYYMVNSSFCYYPGVPIHHSRDLVHWTQIGYCLTTETQANLKDVNFWGGIYAPTIRYHEGTFYMVTTNVSSRGNFIVYTDDPAGQWSEPVWLEQGGIDPSLYFEDGHCFLVSNPDVGIWLCEINPKTGEQLTPSKLIWRGTGGRHPEAPHIYHKDGYYYLLIAEGGTEYGHKVTIARSENIDGPYEPNPSNPILTHIGRNAQYHPVQGTGHADLFNAVDGSWWLVCLGFRPQSYSHHLLGRETFLAPVRWDEGAWPVVNGNGTLPMSIDIADAVSADVSVGEPSSGASDTSFDGGLGLEWNYVSYPRWECYSTDARKGYLRITSANAGIESSDSPALICRRQQHINFVAETEIDFSLLKEGGEAGIAVYMSTDYHYRLGVVLEDGEYKVRLTYRLGMLEHVEYGHPLAGKDAAAVGGGALPSVILRVEGTADAYTFLWSEDGGVSYEKIGSMDSRFLSSETAGGFTGAFLVLYSQCSSGAGSVADFSHFDYIPVE